MTVSSSLLISGVLLTTLLPSTPAFGEHAKLRPRVGPGNPRPTEASDDWLARVKQSLADREYEASHTAAGVQAPNRAQDLRFWFEPEGVRVQDRVGSGRSELLRLSVQALGRAEQLEAVPPATDVVTEANRVEIRHPGLLEWYVNTSAGLEQGFVVERPPAGKAPLTVELSVDGATARSEGEAVIFETAAGVRLRYGNLEVRDAAGRRLEARLEPRDATLRILVNDRGARYPVSIDPLLQQFADAQITSDQPGAGIYSIAGAGDVNGDGYADVIVSAPNYDAGETDEGAVFIFHGGPLGVGGSTLTAATRLESNQGATNPPTGPTTCVFGSSVAGVGDVNGDGYDDVLVGSQYYDDGQTDEGAAFLFLGSASGVANGNPATAAARFESNQGGSVFGVSVAGAGDVNGDGYADIIIGASFYYESAYPGGAFIFLGSAAGIADGTPATAATKILADAYPGGVGNSVAGAGDVNGDGYDDVIVGADAYGLISQGSAFVFHGSAAGIPSGAVSTAATVLHSNQIGSHLGWSVAGAGDVNGDGFSDVVVTALYYDVDQTDEGAAFVFVGSPAGIVGTDPATTAWARMESNQPNSFYGYGLAAGDINGDGLSDVVVGAVFYNGGQTQEGAVFVYFGAADPAVMSEPVVRIESNQASVGLGYALAEADVNGDGYMDVLANAPGINTVFVYRGGPNIYTWNGPTGGDWTLATNWTPMRGLRTIHDNLVFDGAVTPTANVTEIPSETIAQLRVIHGAHATLTMQSCAPCPPSFVTINGAGGPDVLVDAASILELAGPNFIDVVLSSGTTGVVRGELAAGGGFHEVEPTDPGSLVFESGSICRALPGSGYMFGTAGANGVAVFRSGSTYVGAGGQSPFALTPPNSRIVLERGSLYRHLAPVTQTFVGRTYGDCEINLPLGTTYLGNFSAVNIGNLTVVSGGLIALGASITINGNLTVLPNGTFDMNPASSTATILFNGTGAQTIHIEGPGAHFGVHSKIQVAGVNGLTLGTNVFTDGAVELTGGNLMTGPYRLLLGQAGSVLGSNHWVVGNLGEIIPASGVPVSRTFQVGDAQRAAPVTVSFPSVGDSGTIVVRTDPGDHVNLAGSGLNPIRSVNRTWKIDNLGVAFPSSDVTLAFDPADVDAGADPNVFLVGRHDGTTWSLPPVGLRTSTSTQALAVTSLGDFVVADLGDLSAVEPTTPRTTSLAPAWPTPFRGTTQLQYTLARDGDVELAVYGVDGRHVRVLAKCVQPAGAHRLRWDGRDDRGQSVAAGIYYVRMTTSDGDYHRPVVKIE